MTTAAVAPYTNAKVFQDKTIEWRALGGLLDTKNVEWINRLSPSLFTGERINVFYGMQSAYIEYGAVTFEGLHQYLKGNVPGELFTVQGANIRASVDQLARLARKRQAKRTSTLLSQLAEEFDPSTDQIQQALIFDPILAEEDSSLQPGAQILLADIHTKQSGTYLFAKTGLRFLDSSMGGEWKPKSLVIYAGGPGTGKTTLAAQSMLEMAEGYINETTGERVIIPSLFCSLEMAKEDLFVKWLGNKLEIDTMYIQSGKLSKDDFQRIEDETVRLQGLPMYVIDKSNLTLGQFIYEIRKHVFNKGVRVIFIDYLQIVNHHPTGNDNNDLGEFAEAMKALAKRENITVVILSQITPGKDGVFRIRDSGEVGAVADVVFQAQLDTEENGPIKSVTVQRLKNRFGPTSQTAVGFNSPLQRFEDAL